MKKFTLTYSVTTEESAHHGDHAAHGYLTRNGTFFTDRNYMPKNPATFTLRQAIDLLLDRSSDGPVEADCSHLSVFTPPRWFTYGGGWDNCGRQSVQVSLHLPRNITPSSAIRIARLLDCDGVQLNGSSIR